MSTYLSAVNQKRLFAALLIEQARQAGGNRHLRQSLLQGAVLQLHLAVQFYLGEIAATYQSREAASADTARALVTLLAGIGKTPQEASEVLTLENDGDSWMGQLQACYRSLVVPPQVVAVREDDDRIATLSCGDAEDWAHLDPDQVNGWLLACNEMVERQRETMVEC